MIFAHKDGLNFKINQENFTCKIIYSKKVKSELIISSSINIDGNEYIITAISKDSFKDNKSIKSIIFTEDSKLLLIEKDAFYGSAIQSISFPESLNELQKRWCESTPNLIHISISPKNNFFSILDDKILIGKSNPSETSVYDVLVFACRDIVKAVIPSSIKRISSCSFNSCMQLETVEIPENSQLEIIESDAFNCSSIKSIQITSKVSTIEEGWCTFTFYLNSVSISPKNRYFKYIENSSQNMIVGKSNKESDSFDTLVFACRKIKKALIPSTIKYIASFSFQLCLELTEIEFEENSELESIGKFAFARAPVDKITIPSNVRIINDFAFSQCLLLEKVDLSKSSNLFSIGKDAFAHSGLTSISIPASVETIDDCAFFNCRTLRYIEFPEDSQLRSIGNKAFHQTLISNFLIPKHVTHIGDAAFSRLDGNLSIDFADESEIRFFDQKTFNCSSIEKITIPKNVEELADGWCKFTDNLTNVIISPENKNLTYISQNKKLIAQKSSPENECYDTLVFASRNIEEAIIPSYIKRINSYVFDGCYELKSIEFEKESELKSIGRSALRYLFIKKVSIPNKVELIDENAFEKCMALSIVDFSFPSNLISIEKGAFSYTSIAKVVLPHKIKKIGNQAFGSCLFLKNAEIFSEFCSIEEFAFHSCPRLSIFSLPNAKEVKIALNAFHHGFENISIFALANSKMIILD